jgi:hypothetical protein
MYFFASGLFIETVAYRRLLAPEAMAVAPANAVDATTTGATYGGSKIFAFLACLVCFTPSNLVFLSLLAALVGGCASNIVAEKLKESEDPVRLDHERMRYMTESPWSAMMRGFVVYLCVIAGLYFAIDHPFKDSTPAQYVRLAGTLSLMAFVVGYDPSRIKNWLAIVPGPQPSTSQTIAVQTIEKQTTENSTTVVSDQNASVDAVLGQLNPPADGKPHKSKSIR